MKFARPILTIFAPILLLQLFGLSGCQTPQQTLAAQAAVMLATDRVVKDHPDRAARAVAIADSVVTAANADTAVTVTAVMALVRTQIDFSKLDPNEATAVNLLLAAIQTELETRVQSAQIPADLKLKVATVAGWIKLAAEPYLPKP